GTASLFRVGVLREVAAARGARLPGVPSAIYDTAALTEDNEITLAIKTLGHLVRSPKECTVETEVMPSWRDLGKQRLRWQRGVIVRSLLDIVRGREAAWHHVAPAKGGV